MADDVPNREFEMVLSSKSASDFGGRSRARASSGAADCDRNAHPSESVHKWLYRPWTDRNKCVVIVGVRSSILYCSEVDSEVFECWHPSDMSRRRSTTPISLSDSTGLRVGERGRRNQNCRNCSFQPGVSGKQCQRSERGRAPISPEFEIQGFLFHSESALGCLAPDGKERIPGLPLLRPQRAGTTRDTVAAANYDLRNRTARVVQPLTVVGK